MKTETCKLYSRDFLIFLPNIIKIDPYNFELYRFKVGPFFLRHSVYTSYSKLQFINAEADQTDFISLYSL